MRLHHIKHTACTTLAQHTMYKDVYTMKYKRDGNLDDASSLKKHKASREHRNTGTKGTQEPRKAF